MATDSAITSKPQLAPASLAVAPELEALFPTNESAPLLSERIATNGYDPHRPVDAWKDGDLRTLELEFERIAAACPAGAHSPPAIVAELGDPDASADPGKRCAALAAIRDWERQFGLPPSAADWNTSAPRSLPGARTALATFSAVLDDAIEDDHQHPPGDCEACECESKPPRGQRRDHAEDGKQRKGPPPRRDLLFDAHVDRVDIDRLVLTILRHKVLDPSLDPAVEAGIASIWGHASANAALTSSLVVAWARKTLKMSDSWDAMPVRLMI
jgi:hypothetical protein